MYYKIEGWIAKTLIFLSDNITVQRNEKVKVKFDIVY